jgi:hypothetical protein
VGPAGPDGGFIRSAHLIVMTTDALAHGVVKWSGAARGMDRTVKPARTGRMTHQSHDHTPRPGAKSLGPPGVGQLGPEAFAAYMMDSRSDRSAGVQPFFEYTHMDFDE